MHRSLPSGALVRLTVRALAWCGLVSPALPAQVDERVHLRVDVAEAEAVLAIVEARNAGKVISDTLWSRLYASPGYRRLEAREHAMQRSFTQEAFRAFVLSESLAARAGELRRALTEWSARELERSAVRVLAYLPPEARIRATIFPVIKPQTNSFVFDVRGDPAIFLYLDPTRSAAQFENTVAHELHHIGYATVSGRSDSIVQRLPQRVRSVVEWMGAFGEGFAMLAAAGSPDVHPHADSPPGDRERWDRDIALVGRDLRELERFFLDVVEGRLTTEEEIRKRALSFFGEQGPWYTVGYHMAQLVERHFGRAALIACMSDPRQLLVRYNEAAEALHAAGDRPRALWSPHLIHLLTR